MINHAILNSCKEMVKLNMDALGQLIFLTRIFISIPPFLSHLLCFNLINNQHFDAGPTATSSITASTMGGYLPFVIAIYLSTTKHYFTKHRTILFERDRPCIIPV